MNKAKNVIRQLIIMFFSVRGMMMENSMRALTLQYVGDLE